jgi:hypothetical protein
MHAVYHFLCNTDLTQSDEDIRDDVGAQVESYMDRHGDENNWFSKIAVITQDNRVIPFDDGARWSAPDGKTFEEARMFALKCVATDLDIFKNTFGIMEPEPTPADNMNFAELEAHMLKEIPKRLAGAYADLAAGKQDADFLSSYRRRKDAKGFELFYDSKVRPFCESGHTPYDYRAFNLCLYGEGEGNVIVQVDIHT